ncbi:hypothetical protein scyTo_0018675 [Scyliorhinus torazame]|uniref:Ig-like domain-containing protein n=1 Tax=Scyliorhinus torazame TaxID=75743 RepID=A0A401Q0P5_SCYTO|nr:hypothetical protein [Scyliorhinus torazame]
MVELTCHYIYEVELESSYGWYKQGVDEVPKAINISSCNGADCKFISKKGNSKKVLILEIRNVQANDSGSSDCVHIASYAPFQKAATLLVGDSSTYKTAVLIFVPRGELRQTQTQRLHDGALRSQGGPLYASLDLAALEKRSKKKAGRK